MQTRLLALLARPAPPLAIGVIVAAAIVALETLVLFPLDSVTYEWTSGMVYLIGVLALSTVWGAWLGVAMALASVAAFSYFHSLRFSARMLSGADLRQVAIFLTAALVVSGLANVARVHALEGTRRREEADLAADLARLVLRASDLHSVLRPAAQQVAAALDLPAARIVLGDAEPDERWTRFPLQGGTLLVPAGLPGPVLQRTRQRIVPALDSVLLAALDREAISNSLRASREEATSLAAVQAGLRRVATLVARGAEPTDVFDAVTEELSQILGRGFPVMLLRYDPGGTAARVTGRSEPTDIDRVPVEDESLVATVLRTGRAARMSSYVHATGANAAIARRVGARSGVGVPVLVEDRIWGVAIVVSTGPDEPPPDAERRMADFTELVATAIANAESRAQLIASRARIVAATDDARRRLERDLHDGAQQRLVSLSLELRVAQAGLPPGTDDVRQQLGQAVDGLTAVSHDLQEISRGIHPAIVSQGGLGPAVRALARRSGLPVDLRLDVDQRLPERIEVAAYYIISEALTNAAKHAHANLVRVHVEADKARLSLTVRDNGVGGAYREGGSGLLGLQDRVEALDGTFTVLSPPGRGTTLNAEIPCDTDPPGSTA
jgi:signal transduction histidine kinase